MITLIIPYLNERENFNLIKNNLLFFKKNKHLVVDGNSKDKSFLIFKKNKINFITTKPNRGLQQFKGAKKSNTKWLFFLHADVLLSKNNIHDMENFMDSNDLDKVGYFKISYNKKSVMAYLISSWANLRTLIFKLPFGDQGLIISREYYFKLGGHTNQKIMEDLELILKVPKKNRIFLKSKIITSYRAYEKKGGLIQGAIHLLCQLMFFLKFNKKYIYYIYGCHE